MSGVVPRLSLAKKLLLMVSYLNGLVEAWPCRLDHQHFPIHA